MATFMLLLLSLGAMPDDKSNPKDALKGFQELIGAWRGTGEPGTGTAAEKSRGFWKETISWSWKFKGDDAWLAFTIDKGKYYTHGELRSQGDDKFQLVMTAPMARNRPLKVSWPAMVASWWQSESTVIAAKMSG